MIFLFIFATIVLATILVGAFIRGAAVVFIMFLIVYAILKIANRE